MIGSSKPFFWNLSLLLVFLMHNNCPYLRDLIHVHIVCNDDEVEDTGISSIPLLYDEKSANISIQRPDLRRNTELSCSKERDHLGSLWDQNYWPDQSLIAPDYINCLLLSHLCFLFFLSIYSNLSLWPKTWEKQLREKDLFWLTVWEDTVHSGRKYHYGRRVSWGPS